jgi:hypothetical protein
LLFLLLLLLLLLLLFIRVCCCYCGRKDAVAGTAAAAADAKMLSGRLMHGEALGAKGAPVAGADGSARREFVNASLAIARGASERRIGSEEMVLAAQA